MKDERIREEMTKLEFKGCCYKHPTEVYRLIEPQGHVYPSFYAPNYQHDHNAVQRVIDGLDDDILITYDSELWQMIPDASRLVLKVAKQNCATPRQKCEAILKAKGVWEDAN